MASYIHKHNYTRSLDLDLSDAGIWIERLQCVQELTTPKPFSETTAFFRLSWFYSVLADQYQHNIK